MDKTIENYIRNQIKIVNEGRILLLVENCFLFLSIPFLLVIILFIRLLRPFILIRFGKLISSRIGHFAGNTEVYLCERDLGMHGKRVLDIFYINASISNRQLMKMWKRVIFISPLVRGLNFVNRLLPGGDRNIVPWRHEQDRDIYLALTSSKVHISFTDAEESIGWDSLKNLGITSRSPFVCLLSRNAAYLDMMFPKGSWHYHDFRDSNVKNFISAAEELSRRGYFALRMGAVVKEELKTDNHMIIDYAFRYRTDFLDIFLGAKCYFYLGDPCGFHAIPMIFRRPLAIVNMMPVEYTPAWSSNYLFLPKKLWLRKESRFLSFREIMGSEISRFIFGEQYEKSGIEVIENTPEEITSLAIEMDQRLRGEWKESEDDEALQKRFWALFKPSELNKVFLSRIGAEFLRQNKVLLE